MADAEKASQQQKTTSAGFSTLRPFISQVLGQRRRLGSISVVVPDEARGIRGENTEGAGFESNL
jgi:hypothetical protein